MGIGVGGGGAKTTCGGSLEDETSVPGLIGMLNRSQPRLFATMPTLSMYLGLVLNVGRSFWMSLTAQLATSEKMSGSRRPSSQAEGSLPPRPDACWKPCYNGKSRKGKQIRYKTVQPHCIE